MPKHKVSGKIILLIALSTFAITLGLGYYYYHSNNIYGDFHIYVFEEDENISKHCEVTGISFFRSHYLLPNNGRFINNQGRWYFVKLRFVFDQKVIDTGKEISIRFFDHQNNFLARYDYDAETISKAEGHIYVNKIHESHSAQEKLKHLNLLQVFEINVVRYILISIVLLFIVYFIYDYQKRRNRLKIVFYKARFIAIVLLICSVIVMISQFVLLRKVYVYSGVWLLLSVLSGGFLLIAYLLRNNTLKRDNYLTLFSSLMLMLILTEIGLRLFAVNMTYFEQRLSTFSFLREEIPNSRNDLCIREKNINYLLEASEYSFMRMTNSIGISDVETDTAKQDNDFVIIALGDSFTEGDGAHADSTWMKFLEREIGVHDSINYRYINAGICGADPICMYVMLVENLLVYKPDLVITTYGCDLSDVMVRKGLERYDENFKNRFSKTSFAEYIYSLSYIYRLIHHGLLGQDFLFLGDTERMELKAQAIDIFKNSIILYKELALENDFELLCVFYPTKFEIYDEQFEFWDEIIVYANENNVLSLNLLEYYLDVEMIDDSNVQEYYWKIDGHHNAKGYEAFGKGVYYALKNYELID